MVDAFAVASELLRETRRKYIPVGSHAASMPHDGLPKQLGSRDSATAVT